MSIHTDEFDVHICDDPSCGETGTALSRDEYAPLGWYSGTVNVDNVEQVQWSACKPSHIRSAVYGAIADAGNRSRE